MTDKELLRFVTSFRFGMLGHKKGSKYCYMVCLPLVSLLKYEGVDVELIEGDVCYYRYWIGHYWLRLKDGRIIDPTAEQFETDKRPMPRVYLGKKPRWYRVSK